MGKRGPKPVEMGLLLMWEFEWYKALHVLRDGAPLPSSRAMLAPPLHISPKQIRLWIERLRGMDVDEYLRINGLACEKISGERGLNPSRLVQPGDKEMQRWWARSQKENEIAELENYLNPKRVPLQAERRELWANLVRARRLPVLKKICEQWASLPDVRAWGLTCYPDHILANSQEFVRMKRDPRFPKLDSPAIDESRLECMARGMAGILADVSPMTGIEKLRNMKHTRGGPLWSKEPSGREYCNCWHCGIARSRPAYGWSADAWWNGMALFMELAGINENRKQRDGGQR
jgi:hypothetical protein